MPRHYTPGDYRKYHHDSPAKKKARAARNKARRAMIRNGRARKGDGTDVDHIDGNPLNNSPKNLRVVSRRTNRKKQ